MARRRISDKYNLLTAAPALAHEWDYEANGDLRPEQLAPFTKRQVAWKCSEGHAWKAAVYSRVAGSGCPYCSGRQVDPANSLAAQNPKLAREYHPDRNELPPDKVAPRSNREVWWRCSQGHEWKMSPDRRTRNGCPFCSNRRVDASNSLQSQNPDLARQWHPTKNGDMTPDGVVPGSNRSAWWRCEKGHVWRAQICSRANNGRGCPYCSGHLATPETSLAHINPKLSREWHPTRNANVTPHDVTAKSGRRAWWRCARGHEWRAQVASRFYGASCPMCRGATSLDEVRAYVELEAFLGDAIWRHKIHGMEIDVYLPELQIGVEVDGALWHAKSGKKDLRKKQALRSHGIHLFRMRQTPLQIESGDDVPYPKSGMDQASMARLTLAICGEPIAGHLLESAIRYQQSGHWLADSKFKELAARLPGPPLEKSLLVLYPEVAATFHPSRNGQFTPEMLSAKSSRRFWWRCANAHEWEATVSGRTAGNGCPYCSGRIAFPGNNLEAQYPEVAAEWHPKRNGSLKPDQVTYGSHRTVWWLCSKGHEWQATVKYRTASGRGCKECRKLDRLIRTVHVRRPEADS